LRKLVRRALLAKARFGLLKPAPADVVRATATCGSPANLALAAEITAASVTLLRDDSRRLCRHARDRGSDEQGREEPASR